MDHNLILPFTMKAVGVTISDVPNTHCEDPAFDDHSISFNHSDLRMPLQLNGVLSCFHMKVPTKREIHECEKLFLTPDSSDWNPHCQSYKRNEGSILGFEGNMSDPFRRSMHQVVFENEDDEIIDLASTMASVSASD